MLGVKLPLRFNIKLSLAFVLFIERESLMGVVPLKVIKLLLCAIEFVLAFDEFF